MFFFSVLGIHSIKISCLHEIMVPFRSRTDLHAMISISLMREDKRCHGRQQKDEGWLNIMVARHNDGDDSIRDRRSSSLALRHGAMRICSTWSKDGSRSRALQASRTDTAKGVGSNGKNSRATHVSRDKSNKSCGLCHRGPGARAQMQHAGA